MNSLQTWKIYHFNDTSETAQIKLTNNLYDNHAFYTNGANLAAYLYRLLKTNRESYETIVKIIQIVAPFLEDFVLEPNPFNPETILLQWREKKSNTLFNGNFLSDGTLRFIALATLLGQPHLPELVIIDEPELGLHPRAIRLLSGMVKSAAEKTQVIVSTQSTTFINQFVPEDIVVVDLKEGHSLFRRLDEASLAYWLEEYTLGDLWEMNVIGGRPDRSQFYSAGFETLLDS